MAVVEAESVLDCDTWQCQLEELLALQSVYDDDFSILAAPGSQLPTGGCDQPHDGGTPGWWLDPEALLMAGPPAELLTGDVPSCSNSGPSVGRFVAEALVHVDVPDCGLQLVLEVPLQLQQKAPPQAPRPAAAAASIDGPNDGAAANGGSAADGKGPGYNGPGCSGSGAQERDTDGGWATVSGSRNRGGGGGDRGGRGRGRGDQCRTTTRGRGRAAGRRGDEAAEPGDVGGEGGGEVAKGGGRGGRGERGRGRRRGSFSHAGAASEAAATLALEVFAPVVAGHAVKVANGQRKERIVSRQPSPPRAGCPREAAGGDTGPAGGGLLATPLPSSPHSTASSSLLNGSSTPRATLHPDSCPNLAAPVPAPPSAAGAVDAQVEPAPAPAPALLPFGAMVQFLSPIRITLTLPAAYPASAPPSVELQALWLTGQQAAELSSALLAHWDDGRRGAPIAFTWLDWLRTDALRHLGVKQQLVLRATEAAMMTAGAGAGAAFITATARPEGLAVSLMRYSARREQEKFNESNISCAICLEEHLGLRCVRLPECRDAFCGACIATHLRTQLGCGAVDNMRCPAPSCRRQLPPYVLQQLLGPEGYERWEALTLQRTLDKMEDLVYCPRCREPCLEDKDHCTLCPKCFFSFCALCEESWHPGSACLDAEAQLALLEQRREAAAANGDGLSAMERARKELNKRNELKSLALLSVTTKQCPMCCMGVEKTEGCNKMTCTYCGAYFCWKCNQVIRGYDHFQQPAEGEAGCVLFDQQEIDQWNARWAAAAAPRVAHVEQRMVAEWLRQNDREVRLCNCVVCGQRNLKEGNNNNMRCWSCNSHFCYLCRTWLRNKPGAHFGPGRCRQHSDD